MAKQVAIGIQSFDKLREGNYFYIDKTSFIKEWWESGDDVTLLTRPRRFGKTLNMSMLETYGYDDRKEEIKYWYDGFIFGKQQDIYNPWSILNFLDTGEIEDYWANTSSNSLVSRLLREGSERIKREFEALLRGEVLRCSIDEQIVLNQLDQDEDAVWSLLVAAGYLKVLDYEKKYQENGKSMI